MTEISLMEGLEIARLAGEQMFDATGKTLILLDEPDIVAVDCDIYNESGEPADELGDDLDDQETAEAYLSFHCPLDKRFGRL